jgi:hypothetical protein
MDHPSPALRRIASSGWCLALFTSALGVTLSIPHVEVVKAAVAGTSVYTAVTPTRILDSRTGLGVPARLADRATFVLDIGGLAPVPEQASAVVLNVTATDPVGAGFVTAWPAGQTQPSTSVINYEAPGQTIANLVTVPMDSAGGVAFYTSRAVDLIADVQGYYTPAASAAAGRFIPVTPTRVLDTRTSNPISFGVVPPGGTVDIDFRPWGVDADAIAVVIKVTITEATAPGFWTVFAAGTPPPTASNINATAGQTIPNQVITPVADGRATVFSQSGGHLIVDLAGWYTGASSPSGAGGLFVPVTPYRLVDTRDPANGPGVKAKPNSRIEVSVNARAGMPTIGIAAVVVNATVTNTTAAGFFTLWPSRTTRSSVSSLNAVKADQTLANHVITPVTDTGFDFYTQAGADLVADVTGWFTTTPAAPIPAPPAVPIPGPTGPADVGPYVFSWASTPGNTIVTNQAAAVNIPFHWNPCKPIRYVVNMNGYDEQYRATITDDIARVATATGMQFTYVGDTTFVPKQADPWGDTLQRFVDGVTAYDIVISLSNETITDLVPGSLAGLAWPNWVYVPGKDGRMVVGSITIDMGDLAGHQIWAGDGLGPVLLHELGHAVGLNHVPDATQIMNAGALPNGPNTYGAGDLRGLWLVGAIRGCAGF